MHTLVRRALLAAFLLLSIVTGILPEGSGAAQGTPVATPAGTPVPAAVAGVSAAEQALADTWVPVAMLRTQPEDCSHTGEPYVPIAVEISLDDPDVRLRRRRQPGESHDPVVKVAPSAQDLAAAGETHYLDLPGNALRPGCDYEEWSRKRIAELGLEPSVYARIATEADRPGKLALQYWFYYAFDDFNNSHESDWEMLQLTFDAETAEEALVLEPSLLSYAQHSGGENAEWGDDNVELDDGHLLTYPGQGSHADYYQSAIWLAWGEAGSGFGCDQAQVELTRVPLKAIVVPADPDPAGPFAWALFPGRWGEYHPWQFNAPLSPNVTSKWLEPVSWTDDLRSASYPVPRSTTFGIGPGEFFCGVSEFAGTVARRVQVAPWVIGGGAAVAVIGLLLTTILTRRFLGEAIGQYARHWPVFVLSSLLVLAIAALTAWLRSLYHRFGLPDWLPVQPREQGSIMSMLDNGGMGIFLQAMLGTLAAPGVIAATARLAAGDGEGAWREPVRAIRKAPVVLGALVYSYAILLVLSMTLVLFPLAVYRQVQWSYVPHAVMLEGAGWRNARHVSRDVIKGDWLRTLGMAVLVSLAAGIPGPVIGMALVVLNVASLDAAGYVSSAIFAVAYPVTIIASTRYYLWRRDVQAERAARGVADGRPGAALWRRLRQVTGRGGRFEERHPAGQAPG